MSAKWPKYPFKIGPSSDSIQMTVHEMPPDSVQVHWSSLSSHSNYYYDLKVTNLSSAEAIFYNRIKGKPLGFFAILNKLAKEEHK